MANTILNDPSAGNNAATYASQARPDKGDVDVWAAGFNGTGVISGGATTAGSGLSVSVAAATVCLLGVPAAASSASNVALAAANGSNPRVDLVVWDSTSGYEIITGTAAVTPVWPSFAAATQILIAAVTVPAAAVTVASTNIVDKRVILSNAFTLPALNVRTTATHTTASLVSNAQEQSTITMAKSYRLLGITTSVACRVRLYDRAAKQSADASRGIGTQPTGDHGLDYEFVGTSTLLSMDCSPAVIASSMESTPATSIPITVDNLSGSTATITVTLTYMALE